MAKSTAAEPTTPSTPLDRYIIEFLEYCEIEKNKSKLTLRNYHHYLSRFGTFAKNLRITKPEQINLELVRSYRLYLNRLADSRGNNLKLITQQYHVIALRAFLKYLSKRDVKTLAPEKIELAKTPSRQVEAVRGDELRRLLETVAKEPNELVRLRDLAIIHTLFASGVRISELVSLQINGVNLDTGEFTVRGKGDKLRLTFLSPEAVKAIRLYLSKRTDNNPALFVSHGRGSNSVTAQMDGQSRNTGLTARSVQRMLHQFGKLAGIVHKVTPHTLRHGFATDLLQNGADIRSVQTLLGHSSITTTQIYTHVTNAGLRDVHKKFHNKSESHE